MNRLSQRTRFFLLAFCITFFVMAAVSMVVILKVTPPSLQQPQEETPRGAIYYPSQEENLTLLQVITREGQLQEALLIGFYPQAGEIPVLALPAETVLATPQGEMTAQDCYGAGQVQGLMAGIQQTLAITVDRYILSEEGTFAQLYNQFPPITYEVEAPVTIQEDGIQVEIPQGIQKVDGDQLMRLANYQDYTGGEEERLQVLGELVVEEINQNLLTEDLEEADGTFKAIVNTLESDLVYGDFQIRKEALQFMAALSTAPARQLSLAGHYNQQEGNFYLDESMGDLVQEHYPD